MSSQREQWADATARSTTQHVCSKETRERKKDDNETAKDDMAKRERRQVLHILPVFEVRQHHIIEIQYKPIIKSPNQSPNNDL